MQFKQPPYSRPGGLAGRNEAVRSTKDVSRTSYVRGPLPIRHASSSSRLRPNNDHLVRTRSALIRRGRIHFVLIIWLCCLLTGMAWMVVESKRGIVPTNRLDWPTESRLERSSQLPTILMFAHPLCPCTKASLYELANTFSESPALAQVVFRMPEKRDSAWEAASTVQIARNMPGVQVVFDPGGTEAVLFDAKTSGTAMLYSPSGELIFCGGITGSRGHAGDNLGRQTLMRCLANWQEQAGLEPHRSIVYGCGL